MSVFVEAATGVESKEHATTVGRSLIASQGADARVTVVIPCYEQARYLPDAIASLVAQEFTNWQATIINDGSSDNTVEVAEALIATYPDRRISLINQPNSGPSVARNVAIAGTKSEFILPLDADDKIAPSMLGKCVQLLDTRDDLAIAYCDWQYFGAQSHVRQALNYDIETLCHRENLFTLTSLLPPQRLGGGGRF
jgi:glycosyltransferase involved in cell wall biosynthesis